MGTRDEPSLVDREAIRVLDLVSWRPASFKINGLLKLTSPFIRIRSIVRSNKFSPEWWFGSLLTLMVAGQAPAWGEDESVSIAPWRLSVEAPSVGRLKGKESESTLSVQIDRVAGDNPSTIVALSEPIELDPKFEYSLSFQAKSAAPRVVDLLVLKEEPATSPLAAKGTYSLTGSWTSYLYFFRPTQSDPAGQIRFELGSSEADVDVKGFKLTRRPIAEPLAELASAPYRWSLGVPAESKAEVLEDRTLTGTVSVRISKNTSKEPWELNIHRAGYQFEAGREYLIRFRARAARSRTIEFIALRDRAPWTNVLPPEEIPITTEWQEFELPLESVEGEPRGMVQFNLGASDVDVQIEAFQVAASEVEPTIDAFRFRRSNWQVALFDKNSAKLIRPLHGGSVYRIEIDRAPTLERWHINLMYSPIRVIDARDYLIRFRVRAEGERVISFRLDETATGKNLGLLKLIPIGSSWQEIEVPFRSRAETNDARLIFELGGSDIDVELSNITLALEPPSVMNLDRTRTVLVNILAVSAAIVVVAYLVGRDFRRRKHLADQAAVTGAKRL